MSEKVVNRGSNWWVLLIVALVIAGAIKSCISPDEEASPAASATASPEMLAPNAEKLWVDFNAAVKPCDQARKRVGASLDTDDPATVFGVAKEAEAVCNDTWQAVGRLKPPGGAGEELAKSFETALETCKMTEFWKKKSLAQFQKAVDGGMRPSQVAQFREAAQTADAGMLQCAAEFVAAVKQAGGEVEE